LNRAEKRKQLTKKQVAAEEAKQNREDEIQDNPLLSERQKILDEKSHKRFNYCRSKIDSRKKESRIRGKTTNDF
jgi:hypothetical protein